MLQIFITFAGIITLAGVTVLLLSQLTLVDHDYFTLLQWTLAHYPFVAPKHFYSRKASTLYLF